MNPILEIKRVLNMKRTIIVILCIMLSVVFLTGCVSVNFSPFTAGGVTSSSTMEVFSITTGEITEVRVEMLCNIEYYSDPSDTVSLRIQQDLMDHVTVTESGGVLTVRSTRNINVSNPNLTPVLTVSSPSLERVTHAGAGKFTTIDPITGDSFSLNIAGAADGNIKLDVRELTVSLAGAGSFELSGIADNADISMAGAGRIEALDLATSTASIDMSGAGSVRISCSEALTVTAGGVGSVEYRGSPTLDITRGGLVTVKQID